MGVNLSEIVPSKKIEFKSLKGRIVAIDALNTLYQFLAIIRQPTGEHLKDSQGRVTSHLSGLFYRNINLMEEGLKLCYVFDGEPPKVKRKTLEKRDEVKEEARREMVKAKIEGRKEDVLKFAQRTIYVKEELVESSKKLLDLMGIPWVQAPSEGEAQAAYITSKGEAYATASQDFDSLLFGAPKLIRNLTITGRRKLPRKNIYVTIEPEYIELEKILKEFEITREALIEIALLTGTDYNEGVKGIGSKKAFRIVKEKKFSDYAAEHNLEDLKQLFLNPKVTDDYEIKFKNPDFDGIVEFLCEEHDFSETRVEKALERLEETKKQASQTSLDSFL